MGAGHVANPRRAAAEHNGAVIAVIGRSKYDNVVRARRRLPGQPHPACVDRCRDSEDVRCPRDRRAPAAFPPSDALIVSRVAATLGRLAPVRGRLLSQGLRTLLGHGRLRRIQPALEQHRERGRVSPSEKSAGRRTCGEDECRKRHSPFPTNDRRSTSRSGCRPLDNGRAPGRSLGVPESRSLPRFREERPRPLCEDGVDECELRADRAEACLVALRRS